MLKDDDRPQFNPKHRIAGAVILVSLAVIFVPMLLDESAPPKEDQTLTEIPVRDAPQETKTVVTEVPPPATETAKTATTETAPASEATPPVAATEAPKEAPKTDTAKVEEKSSTRAAVEKGGSSSKTKPVTAKPSDTGEKISKGWVVQVGTFTSAENADRLRDKLRSKGFAVNTESTTVQSGKAVRLRVGPYRDKSAATQAQARLQKELSLQGVVQAYP